MLIDNIYLTDADIDITLYPGTPTWDSKTVRVDKENSNTGGHWKRGLDTDTWVLVLSPRLTNDVTGAAFPDQISGTPWIEAARQGVFDGVDVQVDRAYLAAWPVPYRPTVTPVGVLTIFAGRVAEVDTTDTLVILTINDYRELLTEKLPRNVYGSSCIHTLFDNGCALIEANFETAGAVEVGSTRAQIVADTPLTPPASGTFALGKIKMTSGLNSGFKRTITQWTAPATMDLLNPFPFDIAAGDTFMVYPGCDKTQTACALFNNSDNFGGKPYIPEASTAV